MTVRNPIIWAAGFFSELPSADQLQFPVGAVGAPGAVFRGDATTGLYYVATSVRVAVGGTLILNLSATGAAVTGDLSATGNVSGVDGSFSGNVSGANGNFTGNIEQGGNTVVDINRVIQLRDYAVASLPASPTDGQTAFVHDSNQTMAAGIGTAVAAGGTNKVPVYAAGGVWLIG